MTVKSGNISARNQEEARQRARWGNPGWRVVNITKLHSVYNVKLQKIEKKRRKK